MQKTLIVLGIILVLIGLLWPFLSKMNLGNLPGDIRIQKENFSFYFPLTTCLLVSALLTAIGWLINFFR